MSISFQVVMVLVCAYLGWETAGLQFENCQLLSNQRKK